MGNGKSGLAAMATLDRHSTGCLSTALLWTSFYTAAAL